LRYSIGKTTDVPQGNMREFTAGNTEILVINQNGGFFALAARCTHAGAPLVEGKLKGDVLTCPWHGSQFKISDGSVLHEPAEEALEVYKVEIEGNQIFVLI
jgi:nitrite reductase/ring-hydroxylating ferredoxin subunit